MREIQIIIICFKFDEGIFCVTVSRVVDVEQPLGISMRDADDRK